MILAGYCEKYHADVVCQKNGRIMPTILERGSLIRVSLVSFCMKPNITIDIFCWCFPLFKESSSTWMWICQAGRWVAIIDCILIPLNRASLQNSIRFYAYQLLKHFWWPAPFIARMFDIGGNICMDPATFKFPTYLRLPFVVTFEPY